MESCRQCAPCKSDGLEVAQILARICGGGGHELDLVRLDELVATVATGARCFLATQQEQVIGSIVRLSPDDLRRHLDPSQPTVEAEPIVPIKDLDAGGRFVLDLDQLAKQPDWSSDEVDSGKAPVERLATQ